MDRTVNFVRGTLLCAVSLALVRRAQPVLGVIDVSSRPVKEAVVALGDYAVGAHAAEKNRLRFEVARSLASSASRIRMLGSAAIDLAWVAEGKIDGRVTIQLPDLGARIEPAGGDAA